jgi:hypothetical protein
MAQMKLIVQHQIHVLMLAVTQAGWVMVTVMVLTT